LAEAQATVIKLTGGVPKEIRFAVYMHLAAVYLARGNKFELTSLLEKISKFINEDAQFLRPNFLAFTARVKLWNGDRSAAQEWLDHYFITENASLELHRMYQYFTTVRAYIVLGELKKAKNLAVRLIQISKDFCRPQDAAEAGTLLTVVLWAEGGKDESQEMLETVLFEMQPHSFVRIIADEGASILQVLKRTLNKVKRVDYKGLLDPVYVNRVYIATYAVSKQRKGIMTEHISKPVKLSKQQIMIVNFLSQGYDRESIAEKNGVSLNTVKFHLKGVYEKIGVNNAADAVMKARELGVIK